MKNEIKEILKQNLEGKDHQYDETVNELLQLLAENKKKLLTSFINEIMNNKEYHVLKNIDIVERYIKDKI